MASIKEFTWSLYTISSNRSVRKSQIVFCFVSRYFNLETVTAESHRGGKAAGASVAGSPLNPQSAFVVL